MKKFSDFIENIEKSDIPFIDFIILIIAWIFLRELLEGILEIHKSIGFGTFSYRNLLFSILHFPFFYITTALTIIIFTSYICNTNIKHTTKTFAIGLFIIILVPIIDFFASKGLGYLLPYPENIFSLFLYAFSPKHTFMFSWGQKSVLFFSCIGVAFYGYLKTKSILKSLMLFILTYLTVILIGGSPSLIVNLIKKGDVGNYLREPGFLLTDTQKYSANFLLISFLLLFIYSFRMDSKSTINLLKSFRWERNFYYGGMSIGGFLIANKLFGNIFPNSFQNFFDYVAVILLFLIGFLSFQGQAIINDFFDKPADSITRRRNPLVRGIIPEKFYIIWGFIIIGYSLLLALCFNFQAFLLTLSYHFLGYIYSVPPVRLKRIPIVSTLIIAFAGIICFMLGFTIFCEEGTFEAFPKNLLIALLISMTFGFIAKDIKDIEGDKKQGTLSLPILLGKKTSIFIISFSFFIFPLIFKSLFLFIIGIIFSLSIIIYTILLRKENEKFFFILLFIYGAIIIIFLLKNPEKLKSEGNLGSLKSSALIFHMAKQKLEKGEIGEGLKLLDKIIAKNPFFEDAYFFKALSLIKIKEYEKALNVIEKALYKRINPKRFLYLKGILYYNLNEYEKAYEEIKKALSMGHTKDGIWLSFGYLLFKRNEKDKALLYFLKHLTLFPNDKKVIKLIKELKTTSY